MSVTLFSVKMLDILCSIVSYSINRFLQQPYLAITTKCVIFQSSKQRIKTIYSRSVD